MKKFGLDFGTTNSSIAIHDGKSAIVLPIDYIASDPKVLRSMIYFDKDLTTLFGQEGIDKYLLDNKNRSAGVVKKVFTGRMVAAGDGADEVPEYFEEVDYGTGRLLQALKSSLRTSFRGTKIFEKYYSVEELIGLFVGEIKKRAEKELGVTIDEVVSGRPVKFSDDQEKDLSAQQRLEVGLKLAGFRDIKFEYEPVAAARHFLSTNTEDQTVLVFDFGGGTLDTSIVKFERGKEAILATDGVYIGGDLLNSDIMQFKIWDYFGYSAKWSDQGLPVPYHIYQDLSSWYTIPTLNNPEMLLLFDKIKYKHTDLRSLERLIYLIKQNLGFEIYSAIEQAKKELSFSETATITFEDGPIDIHIRISRDEFEDIIQARVEEIREVVQRTLQKARLGHQQIDKVVKTGGSSMIPVFSKMLEDIFTPEKVVTFETFTSIAAGLASE